MSELLIRPHLGLGDGLICNGLVRFFSGLHKQIVYLCKPHNAHTLAFQWRDDPTIEVFGVADDDEADDCVKEARAAGFAALQLGFYGTQPFDKSKWDQEFYRQAGVPFKNRWNDFKVSQQPSRELPIPKKPFALVHDDPRRGYRIKEELLPKHLVIVRMEPGASANLYDWWSHIVNATELHLMESCVAILADSLPGLKATRRCIHHYTRNSTAPTYQLDWEHLR